MRKKVQLFLPELIDQFYPSAGFSTLKLLERAGCDVDYNPNQTSCGTEAYEAGYWEEAKEIGSKFLNDFSEECYIVTPSVASVGMVKNGFNDLFTNTTEHIKCRNIQRNMIEISDFLMNVLKKDYFGSEFVHTAIFHPYCGQWNDYAIGDEPIQLLSKVGGLELLSTIDAPCKIGRDFTAKYESISVAMGERIVQHAIEHQAEYIICNDANCMMHLESIILKQEVQVKTIHLVDVLTSSLPNI